MSDRAVDPYSATVLRQVFSRHEDSTTTEGGQYVAQTSQSPSVQSFPSSNASSAVPVTGEKPKVYYGGEDYDEEPFDSPPVVPHDFRRTHDTSSHSSYDSQQQQWQTSSFPIKEIERMKKKSKRLRSKRKKTNIIIKPQPTWPDDPDIIMLNDTSSTQTPVLHHTFFPRMAGHGNSGGGGRGDVSISQEEASSYLSVRPPKATRTWSSDLQNSQRQSLAASISSSTMAAATTQMDSLAEILDHGSSKEESQCTQPPVSQMAQELQRSVVKAFSHTRSRAAVKEQTVSKALPPKQIQQQKPPLPPKQQHQTPLPPAFFTAASEDDDDDTTMYSKPPSIPSDGASVHTTFSNTTIIDMSLHDLCGEAVSTDDVAWRNALYLLSNRPHLASVLDAQGWTPLSICCLGWIPAPVYMIRALLFVYRRAVQQVDVGGRLPLHLVAASSCDADILQVLVEEYPQALYWKDAQGFTPLQLLLRNTSVELTVERTRILLGWTVDDKDRDNGKTSLTTATTTANKNHVLQRRGQHLNFQPDQVNQWLRRPRPVTVFHKTLMIDHEAEFAKYPGDVQAALRKLSLWKKQEDKLGGSSTVASDRNSLDDNRVKDTCNPAAIPSPDNDQLPVHLVVRRAIINKTPLDDEHKDLSNEENSDDEESDEEEEDKEQPSVTPSYPHSKPSVPYPFDILRLVVSAYPEGLTHKDSDGFTPLLLTMLDPKSVPDLEVVELLLGTRTAAAHACLPAWAEDLALHQGSTSKYMNPAMVPASESGQLPLHLACEELLSDYTIIKAIRECYPGAIHVQDSFGRTPLHTALRTYRRIPVEPRILALLYSDRVAQIRDDHGRLPIDLLLDGRQVLPTKQPHEWEDDENEDASVVYRDFIVTSLRGLAKPSNSLEANQFLKKLRRLPSWLRQQACSSCHVQKLIIDDMASPWKCAMILLDGFLLVALITVFRIQMEQYVVSLSTGVLIATWYTYAVYTAATARLVLSVSFWIMLTSLGEFRHRCLLNLPTWIDTIAMLLSITTSIMLYGSESEEKLLALGTASTGLLWLSLLGYFTTWWYGMAVFSGVLARVSACCQ
jgi:ankyrin repeat protein